jgi:hypothetical protein
MTISVTGRFGTEPGKKDRRISLLNNATPPTLSLPTPQNDLLAGRWQ